MCFVILQCKFRLESGNPFSANCGKLWAAAGGKSKRCATKSDDRQTCNKSDVYLVAGFDFPMSRDTYGLLTVPQLPHDMTQNEVEKEGVEGGWHIQQCIARHANGNKVNSQTNEKLLFASPFERKTARKCGSYK